MKLQFKKQLNDTYYINIIEGIKQEDYVVATQGLKYNQKIGYVCCDYTLTLKQEIADALPQEIKKELLSRVYHKSINYYEKVNYRGCKNDQHKYDRLAKIQDILQKHINNNLETSISNIIKRANESLNDFVESQNSQAIQEAIGVIDTSNKSFLRLRNPQFDEIRNKINILKNELKSLEETERNLLNIELQEYLKESNYIIKDIELDAKVIGDINEKISSGFFFKSRFPF